MDEEANSSGESQYYRTKVVFSGRKIHFPVREEKFLSKSGKKSIAKRFWETLQFPNNPTSLTKLLSKERKKRSSAKPTMIVSKPTTRYRW
jgi:hypothetical protein